MSIELQPDTAHAIQLAVAPAFVLAAVGSTLAVLTNRLARVDDFSEKLRGEIEEADEEVGTADKAALRQLDRRAWLINVSISTAVLSGLLICAMVIATFTVNEFGLAADHVIAFLFGTAMASFALTYATFLIEVYLAAHMLKPTRPLDRK